MDETYTPTTEQVRTHWAGDGVEKERRVAEFDRWFEGQRVKARTVTAEQVEAAARAIYSSDRAGTLPAGFAERSWDLGLAAERDRYLRHARVALEAAGLTVPEGVQA